jgi:hypothetical protein
MLKMTMFRREGALKVLGKNQAVRLILEKADQQHFDGFRQTSANHTQTDSSAVSFRLDESPGGNQAVRPEP